MHTVDRSRNTTTSKSPTSKSKSKSESETKSETGGHLLVGKEGEDVSTVHLAVTLGMMNGMTVPQACNGWKKTSLSRF